MSNLHEFWRDEEGIPYLDDMPLKGVTDFQLSATAEEPLELRLVLHVAQGSGPERLRRMLQLAHQEFWETLHGVESPEQ